jgi:hypothetical protein
VAGLDLDIRLVHLHRRALGVYLLVQREIREPVAVPVAFVVG